MTLASVLHSKGYATFANAAVTEVEFKKAETARKFIKYPSKFADVAAQLLLPFGCSRG